ncbi:hypothetical protein A6411_23835 [Prescottella equi]|uniref:hypothetical protein n=1 Tax=Rhodococcus hoagii TaxID=43767 RepID=UPI0009BD8543|nr:hypothetical protein [Prescottella equi]OQQ23344.1 hypothetical protein A6411_23835 [Prescottella equi]
MSDTITPEEYEIAAKVADAEGDYELRDILRSRAAHRRAEAARDEEAERLAQALFSGTAGHFVTAPTWDAASEYTRDAFRAAARAALDFLAADGRPLPEGGTIIDGLIRTIPGEASAGAQCTGAGDCEASPHIHGCFADKGDCEEPGEHPDSGPDGTPEKPWPTWQEAPDGVVYRGTHRDGSATQSRWMNRGGECWVVKGRAATHPESYRLVNSVAPFVRVDGDKA